MNIQERINQIRKFDLVFFSTLPTSNHNDYALKLLSLHPRYLPDFLNHLHRFQQLNDNVLHKMLDIGAYMHLINNKQCFTNLNDQKLAELLLEDATDLLAENLNKFSNLSNDIAEHIVKNRHGDWINKHNISAFPNIKKSQIYHQLDLE